MSAPLKHRILRCEYCEEPYCYHCAENEVEDATKFCCRVCENDYAEEVGPAGSPGKVAYGEQKVELEDFA